MSTEPSTDEQCPYCTSPSGALTDDHIFPQFLGGRKTIRVCGACNNTFGHRFEAAASRQLARLQVFIAHFGLDLSRSSAIWPSALSVDDMQLDLMPGPDGTKYRLSRPVIYTDDNGKIIGAKARSKTEANRIAKGLIESGKAKAVEITPETDPDLQDVKLDVSASFDPNLFRSSAKMVSATVVASGCAGLISASSIPAYLHGKSDWLVRPAYCDVDAIRKLRPPLAHTVYVELGERSYGIVFFFGFKRVFVPLPATKIRKAILATLDPRSGEELFREVEPVGFCECPVLVDRSTVMNHLQNMIDTLSQDAILCGAKKKPELYIGPTDFGEPPWWWGSSTVRYMFPHFLRW